MSQKVDVCYIRYDIDGTAARKARQVSRQIIPTSPRPAKKKKILICFDPVATVGILIAAVMLILMAVGVSRVQSARKEMVQMEQYVQTLTAKNTLLRETYEDSLDLEEVERMALTIGMVPKEQVANETIAVSLPSPGNQEGFFQRIGTFLAGLFA